LLAGLVDLPHEILYRADFLLDHVLYLVRVFYGLDLGCDRSEAENANELQNHQEDAFGLRGAVDVTVADSGGICCDEVERCAIDVHRIFLLIGTDQLFPPAAFFIT